MFSLKAEDLFELGLPETLSKSKHDFIHKLQIAQGLSTPSSKPCYQDSCQY